MRTLAHSAWFDLALDRLGGTERMDEIIGRELLRIATYADLVPEAPEHEPLRIYRSLPLLNDDAVLIRLWIYFVLHSDDTVELQHIEAVEETFAS